MIGVLANKGQRNEIRIWKSPKGSFVIGETICQAPFWKLIPNEKTFIELMELRNNYLDLAAQKSKSKKVNNYIKF
jgi:hypothetical protein